jgi:hypothetical protein
MMMLLLAARASDGGLVGGEASGIVHRAVMVNLSDVDG